MFGRFFIRKFIRDTKNVFSKIIYEKIKSNSSGWLFLSFEFNLEFFRS